MATCDFFEVYRLLVSLAFVHEVTDRVIDAEIVVGTVHLAAAVVSLQGALLDLLLLQQLHDVVYLLLLVLALDTAQALALRSKA